MLTTLAWVLIAVLGLAFLLLLFLWDRLFWVVVCLAIIAAVLVNTPPWILVVLILLPILAFLYHQLFIRNTVQEQNWKN